MACEAKGPDMNKQFCSSYIHEAGKQPDSDHSDEDDGNTFPGYKIREKAFNILVDNHKDKVFQRNEEQKAKKLNTINNLNQLKDKATH
eukprot:10075803-Heterocapsa_arctica.AAC.1